MTPPVPTLHDFNLSLNTKLCAAECDRSEIGGGVNVDCLMSNQNCYTGREVLNK